MQSRRVTVTLFAMVLFLGVVFPEISAMSFQDPEEKFGPVVRAYLGYLKNEQEVVDDRVSRREVNQAYYRRNSNRIRALREMALRLARQSHNDYLPELEAVASNEFNLLFYEPPRPSSLKPGDVFQNTFRYLGSVRAGEVFYIFARLDIYEQAELTEIPKGKPQVRSPETPKVEPSERAASRPRQIGP